MEQILSTDAEGFYAWSRILVEGHAPAGNAEEEVRFDFFGQDDAPFLVLEICKSQKLIAEYVFFAANEDDKNKTLLFIFDFLRTLDFSLKKLLQWLEQADFVEAPEGYRIQTHGLDISCASLRLTNRQLLQPAVRPPKTDEDESIFSPYVEHLSAMPDINAATLGHAIRAVDEKIAALAQQINQTEHVSDVIEAEYKGYKAAAQQLKASYERAYGDDARLPPYADVAAGIANPTNATEL
jgi:hypothetical protein